MGWILDGLAEGLISIVASLLEFMLGCFSGFELDIGYDKNAPWQEMFSLDYYNDVTGLIDKVFPITHLFYPLFMYMAYFMVIVGIIYNVTKAMADPSGEKTKHPAKIVALGVLAAVGVNYSYTIFILLERVANFFYLKFKALLDITSDVGLPSISDYILNPNTFIEEAPAIADVAFFFLEIGLFTAMMIQFLRLLLEAFERYVVLGLLFFTCPLAFGSIVLGGTKKNETFENWLAMLITAFVVLILNVFFIAVFYSGFQTVYGANDSSIMQGLSKITGEVLGVQGASGRTPALFSTGVDFLCKTCLLIAWLTVGQKLDELLRTLGFSTAQTGHGLGLAVISGVSAAATAAKDTVSAIRGGVKFADKYKADKAKAEMNSIDRDAAQGMSDYARNMAENAEGLRQDAGIMAGNADFYKDAQEAESMMANDNPNVIRTGLSKEETMDAYEGKGEAVFKDLIPYDGGKITFSGQGAADSLMDAGATMDPSANGCELEDGRAVFTRSYDGGVDKVGEVGDAQRWQVPSDKAAFIKSGNGGELISCATTDGINRAQAEMVKNLNRDYQKVGSHNVTWEGATNSSGNALGYAVGSYIDDSGNRTTCAVSSIRGVAKAENVGDYISKDAKSVKLSSNNAEYSVRHADDNSRVSVKEAAANTNLERVGAEQERTNSIGYVQVNKPTEYKEWKRSVNTHEKNAENYQNKYEQTVSKQNDLYRKADDLDYKSEEMKKRAERLETGAARSNESLGVRIVRRLSGSDKKK